MQQIIYILANFISSAIFITLSNIKLLFNLTCIHAYATQLVQTPAAC